METVPSYCSSYQLTHKILANIFDGEVVVEEKIDGSQFSFGIVNGAISCRSKGVQINMQEPPKLFAKAVDYVKSIEPLLHKDWVYRGEAVTSRNHNILCYDRVPKNYIIIFDIEISPQNFLSSDLREKQATRIGLETVPVYLTGSCSLKTEELMGLLEKQSILGGQKIEGFVVKNYNKFGPDKKILLGKVVSSQFKEIHSAKWGENNPNKSDFIKTLAASYKTDARFYKSIIHLKEKDLLTNSCHDIGPLLKEINADILKECKEEIAEKLFKHFWSEISRTVTKGFPEWYKELLLKELSI